MLLQTTIGSHALLRRPHLAALIPFWRRGLFSFALRVRRRRWFRGLRHAALRALNDSGGVGDDVEIVGDGLHGGSSFCPQDALSSDRRSLDGSKTKGRRMRAASSGSNWMRDP